MAQLLRPCSALPCAELLFMRLVPFTAVESLSPWANAWDRLAGDNIFRRFAWQTTWWQVYGRSTARSLHIVAGFDEQGALRGIAPWYWQRSARFGHVVRMLGDGEICSDYLGLLVQPEYAAEFATGLADWLVAQNNAQPKSGGAPWNVLDLAGLSANDQGMNRLVETLGQRGLSVIDRPELRCWRLELPRTWSEYEALLSPSHRKQVRRLLNRYLRTGRAVLKTVSTPAELAVALPVLIDLHAQRRSHFGGRGCFVHANFREFHERVMPLLLERNQLRLHILELDGQPIAAEYHFGQSVVYAYQGGILPSAVEHQPGKLATVAAIAAAIEDGKTAYDFLRGDESYKAHFRAQPVTLRNVRVVAAGTAAEWRYRFGTLGETIKAWLRHSWTPRVGKSTI